MIYINGEDITDKNIDTTTKFVRQQKTFNNFDDCLVIGHRGAYNCMPENTYAAFDYVLENGIDAVEMDIIESIDGTFFVSNNDDLTTLTDIQLNPIVYITKQTSDQISRANPCNLWNYQSSIDTTDNPPYTDQRIPKFKTVLHKYGGKILLFIELKQNDRSVGQRAAKIVSDMGMQDYVSFVSFYADSLRGVKDTDDKIKTGVFLTTTHTVQQFLAYDADWAIPINTALTQQTIIDFHDANIKVFVYTVDFVRDAETYKSWGIDGVICEDPVNIKKYFTNIYTPSSIYYVPLVSMDSKSGLRFTGFSGKTRSKVADIRGYMGNITSNTDSASLAISPGIRTQRNVSITFNVKIFEQSSDTSRAFGMFVLAEKEDAIASFTPPQVSNSYHLFYSQNGNIKWCKNTTTTSVTIGDEAAITGYVTNDIIQCRIDITATKLKFTRVDTDESIEVSDDLSYSQGWFIPFLVGIGAGFSDITITIN